MLSEKEAVERAGRAEGKAATAEKRERDLRTAVIALKNDFEVSFVFHAAGAPLITCCTCWRVRFGVTVVCVPLCNTGTSLG